MTRAILAHIFANALAEAGNNVTAAFTQQATTTAWSQTRNSTRRNAQR